MSMSFAGRKLCAAKYCLMLLATVLVAACGGGTVENGAAAIGADATAGNPQKILAADIAAAGAETTWTLCATEGQTCAFAGRRDVRYGSAVVFTTRSLADGTACNNAVFGDPVYGTVKSCWYASDTAPQSEPAAWTVCAVENGVCTVSGTRQVRYGTTSSYITLQITGQTPCTNAVFGDPAYGTVKTCSVAPAAAAAPVAPAFDGPSGTSFPIVLNASGTAHAGDVVSLQGENFGDAPRVFLDSAPSVPLSIVNRFGATWLAVQIPAGARGALVLRIANATGVSAAVKLNAARPLHLDTLRLSPGGAFRVFGRNLMVAGSIATVTVDGLAAPVDASRSDEYMLTATAPARLAANAASVITVDNGNGTGVARLDRVIDVVAAGSGDPFQLGVGWAAAFATLAGTVVDAAHDPRLATRMICDGQRDDTAAVQAAIDLASANGGGIVQVPAGSCRLAGRMTLASRVVVQGAGKDATTIVYESNYPFLGTNLDLAGVRNLTLSNRGTAEEGPLLKDGSRLFLQNVRVKLGTSRQMYLTGNRNFVVAQCDFEQTGSISDQGPYLLNDSAGLVFENNTTSWMNGAPAFWRVHDSFIHANRFTRDGRFQNAGGTVHSLTLDFAHRIAVVGNTFDVANGPIRNTNRNDGETILTEGGGAQRTENLGTVASAGSNTLSDPGNQLQIDPFGTGSIPENYGVAIVGGKGAGQTRRLVAYNAPTMTVDRAWDIVPDATSHYATFVWGLEKSVIKDNVLAQNPRGIWLYHTALREVDVVGNRISEGGGIYLRSYQRLSEKRFMPHYGVLIADNTVVNTTGLWMSYINSVFVNSDARAFGVATIGVEMRGNQVTANRPNVSSQYEEYAGIEGFANMMRVENYDGYERSAVPRLLGTILTGNRCTYCDVAVRVGTGAGGTTILATTLTGGGALSDDWATTSTSERSVGTLAR